MNHIYIFDLDDTLYCEHDYVRSGFHTVAQFLADSYSIQTELLYNEFIKEWQSHGRGQVFDTVCKKFNIHANIPQLVNIYREHKPTLTLYKDAAEVLSFFYMNHVPMGLITDGKSVMQWNKIKALAIEKYFSSIVVTDDLGADCWKPSPIPFQKVASDLEVDIRDCIYIGDNPYKDFIAAKKLGMKTVRIIRETGDHMQTFLDQEYEADIQINSLIDLLKIKYRNENI